MRILSWLVTVPFSLFALWFALSNRTDASISLNYTDINFTAPIYVFVGASFVFGFFAGAFIIQLKRMKDLYNIRILTKSNDRLLNKISELSAKEAEKTAIRENHTENLPYYSEKPLFFKKQSDIIDRDKLPERKLSL